MTALAFRDRLHQGPILADGAMGTLLHSRGAAVETCLDALNLTQPSLIFSVHHDYLVAGAELIETNTFGANRFKLSLLNLEDELAAINSAGVRIARQAVEASFRDNVYVAASIGPLGVHLEPFGRVTREAAREAFREQAAALIAAGPDLVILETFSDLHEMLEAIRAVREVDQAIPLVSQLTFARDDRTMLGNTPDQIVAALSAEAVDVVGVNCSGGPAQVIRIIARMRAASPDLRLSAFPNAGWPENFGGRVIYARNEGYFADFVATMRDLGVSIIGGCCGTTPEHISVMRDALADRARKGLQVRLSPTVEEGDSMGEAVPPSELARRIARGDFIIAVEVSPPKGIAAEKVIRAANLMNEAGADVIDVTDSPMARMRMSPWAACYLIQSQVGIETVLHFPTRGRNILRVQGDLLGAHSLGIRNLFVVMGDPTRIGDYPEALDNYDVVPSGLIRLIKENLNRGIDWAGGSITLPTNFLVSSAINFNPPDVMKEIATIRKKLEAGADYFISQPVFEADTVSRFIEQLIREVPSFNKKILVGIMPLYSLRHASFLHNEIPGITIPPHIMSAIESAGDAASRVGVELAASLAGELKATMGGLYLLPQFGRYDLIAEIIESVR